MTLLQVWISLAREGWNAQVSAQAHTIVKVMEWFRDWFLEPEEDENI